MVLISFIQIIKLFGIILIHFQNLIDTQNSPLANYKGELYSLPFNMNTFYQIWGVTTPIDALAKN